MVNVSITDKEKNVLKEIGGIGMGHASSALGQIINQKIELSAPDVNLIDLSEISRYMPENDILMGIHVKILGDINGQMLYLFTKKDAKQLLGIVRGKYLKDSELIEEMEVSTIKEISNIVSGSYLNALSSFLGLSLLPSLPHLAVDSAYSIFDFITQAQKEAVRLIIIQSKLSIKEVNFETVGSLIILLSEGELQKIIEKIEKKYGYVA